MKLSRKSFLYLCSFFSLLGAASAMPGSDEENKVETSNPAPAVAHFKAKDVLPLDMWAQILKHLTPQDKLRLMRVNQSFRSLMPQFITDFITKPQNSEGGGFLTAEAYAWLTTFPNLTSFKLTKNFVTRDETRLRFPALQTFLSQSKLKKLDLSENAISNYPSEDKSEYPIVSLMQNLPQSIEELNLGGNFICIHGNSALEGLEFLGPLAEKPNLKILNLSDLGNFDLGSDLRGFDLLKKTSIEKLYLEKTRSKNEYIEAFIRNAPEMSLTDLYVANTGLEVTEEFKAAYAKRPEILNKHGDQFNVHFEPAS
ncbi:MAG: F-box protein [Alphaproteobacteria bacterium]